MKVWAIILFSLVFDLSRGKILEDTSCDTAKTFLYFAYGSNLLSQRILINNPTAIRRDIGKLKNYRLDFGLPFSKKWGGCPATVVPDKGQTVWGAVWEINESDMANLDRQEGVDTGAYFPIQVRVTTSNGTKLDCRSYQLSSAKDGLEPEDYHRRLPSQIYVKVIIKGAKESGLPPSYIKALKTIKHNGSKGGVGAPIKSLE